MVVKSSLIVMGVVQRLINVIATSVAYIITYYFNHEELEQLSRQLCCTAEELAVELHMKPALFGVKGTKEQKIQGLLREWFEDDPYASSLKLIQHLINLNELETIESWVSQKYSERLIFKDRIEKYHLQLLAGHYPSDLALLVTAQAIVRIYTPDPPDPSLERDLLIKKVLNVLAQYRGLNTRALILALCPYLHRASNVLKLHMLSELNLCVIPEQDNQPDATALSFIANHLAHSPRIVESLEVHNTSYLALMRFLKAQNESYALAMVLMMTGSAKRNQYLSELLQPILDECTDVLRNNKSFEINCGGFKQSSGDLLDDLQQAGIVQDNDIAGITRFALGECIITFMFM